MKQGALIFDERSDRYDIRFDLADYYGGLHCGETFDVMVGGRWKPTRIEYGDNRLTAEGGEVGRSLPALSTGTTGIWLASVPTIFPACG